MHSVWFRLDRKLIRMLIKRIMMMKVKENQVWVGFVLDKYENLLLLLTQDLFLYIFILKKKNEEKNLQLKQINCLNQTFFP
jgi:hypothetical protein